MARMTEDHYKTVVKGQIRLAMETLNSLLIADQGLPALEAGVTHALGQLQSAQIMAFKASLLPKTGRPPTPTGNAIPNNVIPFTKRGA